jgi:uncharacterized membrane protein YciS (DUF1049 family)
MKYLEPLIKSLTLFFVVISIILAANIITQLLTMLCEKNGFIMSSLLSDIFCAIFCVAIAYLLRPAAINIWYAQRNKRF